MNFPIRQTIGNAVKGVEKGVSNYVKNFKGGPGTMPQSFLNRYHANMAQGKAPRIASYKKGGMVHKTGLAMLHKGEYVVPKHQVDAKHNQWMLSSDGALKLGDHTDATS